MQEALSYLLIILLAFQAAVPNASAESPRAAIAARKCKKAPPAAHRRCGVKGGRKTGFYFEPSLEPARVASAVECGYLCARRARKQIKRRVIGDCGSFAYDSKFGSCTLFFNNVSYQLDPKYNGRPREFFDLGCYDCGDMSCDTPNGQPYGAQLLDNGGFEDDFLGPWEANVHIVRNTQTKNIHVRGGYVSQTVNYCNNEYYEVSFDYKYDKDSGINFYYPSGRIRVGYRRELQWGTGIGNGSDTDGQWKRGRFIFQANLTDSPSAYNGFSDATFQLGSYMSLDNVTLARRAFDFTPVPGAVSIVPNGGFESGKAAPWRIGDEFGDERLNNSVIKSPGLNGSKYAAKLHIDSGQYNIYLFNKNIPTKPQTWYMMSARVRNASPKPNKLQYVAQIFYVVSDGISQSKRFDDGIIVDGFNSWPFFVPGNVTTIAIDYFSNGPGVFADEVKLVELES